MVIQGFQGSGVDVGRVALSEVPCGLGGSIDGCDLVVYLTEELGFADGGPQLMSVAEASNERLVPVILVAAQCRVSTRELRTWGVEAGYEVSCLDDVVRIARTWVPR